MLAAIQDKPAAPPVIQEMSPPEPRPDEVLIQVRTMALGGHDIVGAYRDEMSYPCVVRGEGVGFDQDGRRVYFGERSRLPYGAFAEQTAVPRAEVWEVPEDISDRAAINMGIAGTGAYEPLKAVNIQPGENVLITGATGAVGQIALQLARHMGAGRVVAAGRNRATLEALQSQGKADGIAVLNSDQDLEALKAVAPEGYDVVLDVLYGPYFPLALKATRFGARIITIGAQAGGTATLAAQDLDHRWHIAWGTGQATPKDRQKTWHELLDFARKGVDVNLREFKFDQVAEAYEAQRAIPHGKVIVTF